MEDGSEAVIAWVPVLLPGADGEPPEEKELMVRRPAEPATSDPVRAAGLSSDLLAATSFMAWGYEAIAEVIEQGGPAARAVLELWSSPEAAAAFAAVRDERQGAYDPEVYLPTIAQRFYG